MSQNVRANLHGTIFVPCDNGLQQAHDMIYDCCVHQKKCRSILKHVLKCHDNRRPVVCLSHATKIVPCKSSLISFEKIYFSKKSMITKLYYDYFLTSEWPPCLNENLTQE